MTPEPAQPARHIDPADLEAAFAPIAPPPRVAPIITDLERELAALEAERTPAGTAPLGSILQASDDVAAARKRIEETLGRLADCTRRRRDVVLALEVLRTAAAAKPATGDSR